MPSPQQSSQGVLIVPAVQARKSKSVIAQVIDAYQSTNSYTVPAAGTVEVAFSPNEGSEHLVIKVIDSAKSELELLSYSFTSVPVVEALVRARHRGVKVTRWGRARPGRHDQAGAAPDPSLHITAAWRGPTGKWATPVTA